MDLDQIKAKLNNLQNSTRSGGEKKDYSKIFWSPKVGKHEVRIVPSKFNKNNPFTEVKVYYGIGPNRTMISPLNFGEEDPIAKFSEMLLKGEYDKDKFILANKLKPKVRTFVPVIVRGEEDKGVRLWQFGKSIYEELLNMALDEEVGDFTDVMTGTDLKLTTTGPEQNGTAFNKTTLMLKRNSSPLSKDKKEIELWLEEQPNPLENFKRFTFDEMKDSLDKWLTPEVDEDDDVDENIMGEEEDDMNLDRKPAKKYNANKSTGSKVTKEDEWNDIFKDENED